MLYSEFVLTLSSHPGYLKFLALKDNHETKSFPFLIILSKSVLITSIILDNNYPLSLARLCRAKTILTTFAMQSLTYSSVISVCVASAWSRSV